MAVTPTLSNVQSDAKKYQETRKIFVPMAFKEFPLAEPAAMPERKSIGDKQLCAAILAPHPHHLRIILRKFSALLVLPPFCLRLKVDQGHRSSRECQSLGFQQQDRHR